MDSPTLYDDKGCQVAPQVNTSDIKTLTLNLSCVNTRQTGLSCLGIDSPDFERLIASPADVLSAGTPTTQILFPKLVTEEQEAYARGFVDALEKLHKCQGQHGLVRVFQPKDINEAFLLPPATKDELTPSVSVSPGVLADSVVPADMMLAGTIAAGTFTPSICVSGIMSECLPMSAVNSSPIVTMAELQHLKEECITTTCNNTVRVLSSIADITPSHVNSLKHVTETCYVGLPRYCSGITSVSPLSVPIYLSTAVSRSACGTVASVTVPSVSSSSIVSWLEETAKHQWEELTDEDIDGETCSGRLEHKRARNRLAAQRCRMRKLERITELSERVHELQGENDRLLLTSTQLQQQIGRLKSQILQHVSIGCIVTMNCKVTLE